MEFSLSCRVYTRLLHLPLSMPSTDYRDSLRGIYVERSGGKLFAISTNARFAAIEYLGESAGDDGSVILTTDPLLTEQVASEAQFDSHLFVLVNSMLNFTTAKTSYGFVYPGNAAFIPVGRNEFPLWRSWLPPQPIKKTKGAMFVCIDDLAALARTAPSGSIVFPEFIDNDFPVIVRDASFDNWLGVFVPRIKDQKPLEPATLPAWVQQ